MKKKLYALLGLIVIITIFCVIIIMGLDKENNEDRDDTRIQVVTSFYPTFIVASNILDGIPEIRVQNLTDSTTGCLHDYQLTTQDMKIISTADLFIMNGGGMEGYIDEVIGNYPDLNTINLSKDIPMLESNHHHEHHDEDHVADQEDNHLKVHDDDHTENHNEDHMEEQDQKNHENISHEIEYNSHVWLNPRLYIKQIENARDGLIDYVKSNSSLEAEKHEEIITKIEANAENYMEKVTQLDEDITEELKNLNILNKEVVIFHDAFAYLADRVGLVVAYSVEMDSESQLSATEIADIVDHIKEEGIRYLFIEEQFGDTIAQRIQDETDATVYIIDSAVTGDGSRDSYLTAMKNNLEVIKEALQ